MDNGGYVVEPNRDHVVGLINHARFLFKKYDSPPKLGKLFHEGEKGAVLAQSMWVSAHRWSHRDFPVPSGNLNLL